MSRSLASVLVTGCALLSGSSSAFAPQSKSTPLLPSTTSLGASSVNDQNVVTLKEIDNDLPKLTRRTLPAMSTAIPFLERPPMLDGSLAGDVGFDPMMFAKNEESLLAYREAEIKHGRLAMLAAAGWPVSELLDRQLADYFGVPSVLDDGDRVPSVLNGGLEKVVPEWWGFCLGMCAAIDLYGVQRARSGYLPGDLGWDPLGLYPQEEPGRQRMQLAEIKHGRIAMLGVTGFAVQEYVSKLGVVDETPFFFYPLTRTIAAAFNS